MSTAELKLDVISKITSIDESRIIEDVKRLLDFELGEEVYRVSNAQRKRLLEAQTDAVLDAEAADKEIDEWLGGK